MNYLSSIAAGVLAVGWVQLIYFYLFNWLYFSFDVSSKVEYCRGFIQGNFCNSVVYVSLWLMEFPLALFSFLTWSLFLVLLKRYVEKFQFNIFIVTTSYVIASFICFLIGANDGSAYWFALFTTLWQGAAFLLSAKLIHKLTNRC
jgi:hypothetical protein